MKKYLMICVLVLFALALVACNSENTAAPVPQMSVETTQAVIKEPAGTETAPLSTEPSSAPQVDVWVFPDSDQRYLTADELVNLPAMELAMARNEIFARKGCIFADPAITDYFSAQSWYVPEIPEDQFSVDCLNEFERSNACLIELCEKMRTPSFHTGNPYEICYDKERPYVIPNSHDTPLSESDYLGLSVEMTYIAWNEILARHGYVSDDQELMEYFIHQTWYRPNTSIGDESSIVLSDVERENIRILKEYQINVENQGLDTELTNPVSCEYFSVMTPAFWAEYAIVESGADSIRFREKCGYEAGMGGHVFTMLLYSEAAEYQEMPAWKLLGELTDSEGKAWHLVAIYPTDVQFDPEDADMYIRMEGATDDVIATITAADGCTFTPVE